MREIKFRGKRKYTGDWIYGDLIHQKVCDFYEIGGWTVNKDTIGQFTGLYDTYYTPIYEGDILRMKDRLVQVVWHEKAACWDCNFITYIDVPDTDFSLKGLGKTSWWKMYKVVGNIYDNKNILEGELTWGINHLSSQNKN
jgi:hypothetical protein